MKKRKEDKNLKVVKASIICPKCGHNEVNVAVWGSGTTKDDNSIKVVSINIDDKCEDARCIKCGHEAHYLDFKNN